MVMATIPIKASPDVGGPFFFPLPYFHLILPTMRLISAQRRLDILLPANQGLSPRLWPAACPSDIERYTMLFAKLMCTLLLAEQVVLTRFPKPLSV